MFILTHTPCPLRASAQHPPTQRLGTCLCGHETRSVKSCRANCCRVSTLAEMCQPPASFCRFPVVEWAQNASAIATTRRDSSAGSASKPQYKSLVVESKKYMPRRIFPAHTIIHTSDHTLGLENRFCRPRGRVPFHATSRPKRIPIVLVNSVRDALAQSMTLGRVWVPPTVTRHSTQLVLGQHAYVESVE